MHLNYPDMVLCWTDNGQIKEGIGVEFETTHDSLKVFISSPDKAVSIVKLRWNVSVSSEVKVLGDAWERGYGDLEWRCIVPDRYMPWYFFLYNQKTAAVDGCGVETGCASFCSWQVDPQGITLNIDIRSGGLGVKLGARTLQAATIRFFSSSQQESLFTFAHRFCRALCSVPRLPNHTVYGGNDWYYAYGNSSDQTIRRDAELIRDLSPNRNNAPYMVIDGGWFPAKGCDGGPYDRGNDRFPDMPALAQWMKSQEVRPGIWIRPLLSSEAPAKWCFPADHPITHRQHGSVLDPSIPEVISHVKDDIVRLREWGYELIKHDFSTYDITGLWGFEMHEGLVTPSGWTFADNTRTTAEIVLDFYTAIREAAGDSVLIGCNTVGHLGAGLFELQRTGDDTSGRVWERTRKMGVNTLAFRMCQHNTFFAADADCVGITEKVDWNLNRQWLDLLAKSGTPLFVSADPAAVGTDQKIALKEAFDHASYPHQSAEPEDWLETTCPVKWNFKNELVSYKWIPTEGISALEG